MDTQQALSDLGAGSDLLTQQNRDELDEKGYTVLLGLIDDQWLEALRTQFEELCDKEGSRAGLEVHQEYGARRLADLVNKGEMFDTVYTNPTVLAAVYHVIGKDLKLGSLNARDALPGEGLQRLHPDWDGVYDGRFHVCNSIWLLDDFTEENGCTRLVPGTHLVSATNSTAVLTDPMAPHPQEEYLIAPAGSVAVFNSHVWHGGTLNRTTDAKRRALHCYFMGREHEQQLNQRDYITHETWMRISRAARYILDVDLD
ncbi:MAG: phytanoyl-CoA dioxygenase family protein [SAR202 cluster bacterium]|nr:phytanoyl-CoA dioxygenase family protein [SAR202 cluster bacterium]